MDCWAPEPERRAPAEVRTMRAIFGLAVVGFAAWLGIWWLAKWVLS